MGELRRGDYEGAEVTFWGDGYVHCLESDDSLLHINYIKVELLKMTFLWDFYFLLLYPLVIMIIARQ